MTLAILSWGQHPTLINTLDSYKKYGLDKVFEDKYIFFQEISKEDIRIARDYGYHYMGNTANIGIARAYAEMVDAADEDVFLFLENDWEMIEPLPDIVEHAAAWLRDDHADVVRFRHRRNPGNPLWTRQFEGQEYVRPTHLLDAVHWTYHLDAEEFTGRFKEIFVWIDGLYRYYITTARNGNWTNNPTMFRTEFLREHILPRIGTGDAELQLQPWWEQQDFVVAHSDPGLFTHRRL